MANNDVVIIGAGLAGLCCALRLEERGVACQIVEAAEAPGGRVRTDTVDGFQLDRGFQVLLTAYPEARQRLDYDALQLGRFESGALIRTGGGFHRIGDPYRNPSDLFSTLVAPVGGLGDKWKIAGLRRRVCDGSLEELYSRPETSTRAALEAEGFSPAMIERFFKPFFSGIFLEPDLATSSRKFEFVFRMFSQGHAALPAAGMEAIPRQLAARLKPGTLRLNSRAFAVTDEGVRLASGDLVPGKQIVFATDAIEAARFLGRPMPPAANAVTCLYFAAKETPVRGGWLVLNGEGSGIVNNLAVPSEVCRPYAPAGLSLISVSVLSREEGLETRVREQLTAWYGNAVAEWRLLKTYRIPYALPAQPAGALDPVEKPVKIGEGRFWCGDHTDTASIQGAMISGRRAAEAVIAAAR